MLTLSSSRICSVTNEETNPKNVIVNTNTIDEMVICEETGLKYVILSATTLTKNPVKTNKKAKARNQLEIDEVITSALHAVSCCSVSLSWNVFFVFWLFIPFCASFFPSCSFWDLAGIAFARM
jgi:hypothetical protein